MKKSLIIVLLAIAMLFSGCVKNLEEYGFSDITILKGKVIEETEQVPLAGINVSITNGSRTYSSCSTGENGIFELEVNYHEIDAEYYLLLRGKGRNKKYDLKGMGQELYDYRDIVLYAALPTFEFEGITYEVYPTDINNKTWQEAQEFCAELVYSDCDNWSLPSIYELVAMYENRGSIGGFSLDNHWSGTYKGTYGGGIAGSAPSRDYYYTVDFGNGEVSSGCEIDLNSFRPIRISTSGSYVPGAPTVTTNCVNYNPSR